ncbi:MAG TPA: LamG-like jellyroll fold domain-containing protein [Lacipirellulaceae bacterium]|jgi:hypothetical protein|nr:LamG-like jellyroll fold domain-containing protein [Lacipirellulaceae bacterium]
MNRDGCFSLKSLWARVCAVGVAALLASPAFAALTNKYTFNDNTANDSIGGQHGTVVDRTGISRFVGGTFDMTGNNGAGSNQDFVNNPNAVGAFIDLPNGIISSAVNNGDFGEVSLEIWLTTQQNRNWAEAYSFGVSVGGENMANEGDTYVALIPQSGIATPDFRATTRDGTVDQEVPLIGSASPLPAGVKHHVVYALNHNDTTAGPNGTGRLYLNGTEVGNAQIATFLDTINDVNNWLGRSQWPDPLYDGTIDEFRIYSHALDQSEVTASFNTGPEPSPTPTLVVDRSTGAISVANQTTVGIQLKGYSIMSAAGSLNPATWTSIDADNTFDTNGTWTAQSSTSTNLRESVTGGTLDGGSLAIGGSRSIGTPWLRTPFEDLVFEFTLGDNTTGFGVVQYGGTAALRSDLNGDGQINVADWTIFYTNGYTNLSSETLVGAYRRGDLDGDRDNDIFDYRLFKADYTAANGAAAFAALEGAVPEPSTMALLAIGLVSIFRRRIARGLNSVASKSV